MVEIVESGLSDHLIAPGFAALTLPSIRSAPEWFRWIVNTVRTNFLPSRRLLGIDGMGWDRRARRIIRLRIVGMRGRGRFILSLIRLMPSMGWGRSSSEGEREGGRIE